MHKFIYFNFFFKHRSEIFNNLKDKHKEYQNEKEK